MQLMPKDTKQLTRAAIIGALYAALTLALAPISYGEVQLRVSEALTLLPVLWPEAVPGLFIGCFLANLLGPGGLADAVVGGTATLIAATLTLLFRKRLWAAALPPVIINGIVIGLLLFVLFEAPLLVTMGYIALGQAVACYALGIPLILVLKRTGLANKL